MLITSWFQKDEIVKKAQTMVEAEGLEFNDPVKRLFMNYVSIHQMNEQVIKSKTFAENRNYCNNLDSDISGWISRNREKIESMKEEEDCAVEIMNSPAKRLIG